MQPSGIMNNKIILFLIIFLFLFFNLNAQDKFCKVWYTQEGTSKVQIYLGDDGKYYGKIVWLRDGIVNGKPLIDTKNPDANKRSQPWLGLQIISGLVKKSETEIVNGKIYDPTKGNYYSCKMTVADNKLELRGYILGMPFLGRTTTWYLAEEKKPVNTPIPPRASGTKTTNQPQ
jgi:uncharacterized protein (DUF2147 family)